MKQVKKFVFLIFVCTFSGLIAQETPALFEFDMKLRHRFESWEGMNARYYGQSASEANGKTDDKLLYQRIIAGFTYRPLEKLSVTAHIQDSRACGWSLSQQKLPDAFKVGDKSSSDNYYIMNPGEEYFEIHDAYLHYKTKYSWMEASIGRQKINFGDNRFFGPGDWGNTGRWTWDAFKIDLTHKKKSLHLFAGGTKVHNPLELAIPFTNTQYWGAGIYGKTPLGKVGNLEPLFAYRQQGSAPYIRNQFQRNYWAGFRMFNEDIHQFVFDMSFAWQWGHIAEKPLSAFGLVLKGGYRFINLPGKPLLFFRESYASGGKNTQNTLRTFNSPFGASDKYYGWMGVVNWSNLDNREVVLEVSPLKKMWIEMKYNRYYIPSPTNTKWLQSLSLIPGEKLLGDEFGFFSRYQLNSTIQIVAVYSFFWPAKGLLSNQDPSQSASFFALQTLINLEKQVFKNKPGNP